MAKIETSISINKPVEQVFEFIANPGNQKALSAAITDVVFSGPVKVGTQYTIKSKYGAREFNTVNEVVALEPNKTFGIKTLAAPPASDVVSTYSLEKDGAGTKLSISMDAIVMPGTEAMVVPQIKMGMDTGLAAVKKALDG